MSVTHFKQVMLENVLHSMVSSFSDMHLCSDNPSSIKNNLSHSLGTKLSPLSVAYYIERHDSV